MDVKEGDSYDEVEEKIWRVFGLERKNRKSFLSFWCDGEDTFYT